MNLGFLIIIFLLLLIPSGVSQGIKIKITSKNESGEVSQ